MVGFQHFLVLVFLVGLLFANLCSSTCSMHLDDSCPAQVWQDQYRCIMNQNSLQTIMDCIFVDDSDSAETSVCRPKDSINDPGEEELYTTKKINGKSMLCIVPRSVLVYGPQYRIGGWWPASMAGVLRVCPAYDPNFLNCLCEHNVRQARIAQFALNFKPDSDQNFSCDKFAKRATLPEDILDLSPYNSTSPDIRLQARDSSELQMEYIDDYGRPVYDTGYVGFPLPFYDQGLTIDGKKAAKRCYVDPFLPVIAACTTWLLPSSASATYATQPPVSAKYTREYTVTSSAATVAPKITSVATVSSIAALQISNSGSSSATGSSPSTSSGTPTGSPTGSSTGSAPASTTSASKSNSLASSAEKLLAFVSLTILSTSLYFNDLGMVL